MSNLLELLTLLDTMEEDEILNKLESLKEKYAFLDNSNPKLFKKLMSDPTNIESRERIKRMVKLYEDIQSGKTTQHNASVKVGQELADQYLGHVINTRMTQPE